MIIYCIKNKVNQKEYIGLTKRSLEQRWKQHVQESNRENSWEWNTPLGNAIKKYGKNEFDVFILEYCKSEEELKQKEIQLIEERKSLVKFGGYNLTQGGDGRLGFKLSEETKRKISIGNKGKTYTEESLQRMRVAAKKRSVGKLSPMQGKKHTEEAKLKIVSHLIGRKQSEETRRKRSESMKAFIQNKKMEVNYG
jgi:group I intron endonuclease